MNHEIKNEILIAIEKMNQKVDSIQEQVEKIPEIQKEVAKISEIQKEVAKIPEMQKEIAKIPEMQKEIVKIPEMQKEIAKIPEMQKQIAKIVEMQGKLQEQIIKIQKDTRDISRSVAVIEHEHGDKLNVLFDAFITNTQEIERQKERMNFYEKKIQDHDIAIDFLQTKVQGL